MNHQEALREWDLVIEPRTSIFKLGLRDVWRYRDLLVLLVRRDFVSFYKQTLLGPIWFFLQPLFTTIIFVFIFGNLAKLGSDGLPHTLFYMTSIIAWNYFADCLNKTSTVFKDNASIFGKVYFPRLIMPLSIVVSNLVKFGVQLALLILTIIYFVLFRDYQFVFTPYIFLFPVLIILMAMTALGMGMIISAMTTKYRDLSFLVVFGVQLLMYATPVIYSLSDPKAEKFRNIIEKNPLTPLIEGFRLTVLGKGFFDFNSFLYSLSFAVLILISGMIVFNRVEKSFVDTV